MPLPSHDLNSSIPRRGGEKFILNLTSSTYWYRRRGRMLQLITIKDIHTQSESSGGRIGPSQRPLPENTFTHKRQTSMPPARFEPAVPESKLPLNHALDRAVTGTGRESSPHHNGETGSGAHHSPDPETSGSHFCRLKRTSSVASH